MVNEKTILEDIAEISTSLDKLVWITLLKLKQPPLYDFDDLRSEAITKIISVMKSHKHYNKNKGAEKTTFYLEIIRNHFTNLIQKSYFEVRGIDLYFIFDHPTLTIEYCFDSLTLEEILDELTDEEIDYLNMFINTPEYLRIILDRLPKNKWRKVIRKYLNISWYREKIYRESIRNKIAKLLEED